MNIPINDIRNDSISTQSFLRLSRYIIEAMLAFDFFDLLMSRGIEKFQTCILLSILIGSVIFFEAKMIFDIPNRLFCQWPNIVEGSLWLDQAI